MHFIFPFTRNKSRQRNKMTGKGSGKLYIKRCNLWRPEKNMYNSK